MRRKVRSQLASLEAWTGGFNYANQEAMVEFDAKVVNEDDFQRALQAIGYDIIPSSDDQQQQVEAVQLQHYKSLKTRTIWAVSLAIPLVILGMFFMNLPYVNWMMMVLSAPIVFYFGGHFFTNAFKQARHGKANMDTLVALIPELHFIQHIHTIIPAFWHHAGLAWTCVFRSRRCLYCL